MDESQSNVEKTTKMTMNASINERIPRLKKNRRLELRWGQQYYTALKDAVFSVKNDCYMTSDMPSSLQKNNTALQKNFVCKSCGDSFHFQSSFDDHNSRYSWILGYWCSHCFQTQCDHSVDENSFCLTCHNVNKSKRAYLKTKGLRKGHKVGATLLFHNQCQFFQHLKKHNVTAVDMSDIMLMPMPHNIQEDEYSQIDHVCESLMEYMFIKRIHIMDWLRINNINSKWWKTENLDTNAIGELLRNHNTDCTDATIRKNRIVNGRSTMMNDSEHTSESSEDDDNPCDTEISFNNSTVMRNSLMNPINSVTKTTVSSTSIPNKPSAMLASVSEIDDLTKEQNIQISTSTSSHPLNSIHNKKIIIISHQGAELKGKDDVAGNSKTQSVGKGENTKTTTVITSPLSSVNSDVMTAKKNAVRANKNVSYMKTSDHRVVLPPGAKIVFRQLQKPATSILKVDLDKNSVPLVTPKFNIVKNKLEIVPANKGALNSDETKVGDKVSGQKLRESTDSSGTPIVSIKMPLTDNKDVPVPVSEVSEKPSSVLLKKITDKPKKMRSKKVPQKGDTIDLDESKLMIVKYRESMKQNLRTCSAKVIRAIIANIKEVNRKYQNTKKCVDVKNIIAKNLAAIKKFERYLENSCNSDVEVSFDNKISDVCDYESRDWESQYFRTMIKPECNKCRRKLKPADYITGISKPTTNESKFCECYNCICHLCDSKLGTQKRYQAHIRFHKKEPPYVCPECDDTFNSMFHLETHIWTKCFHIMTQQFFSCQICEIEGFITMEDVTRHYAHVHTRNVVFCNECQRLFNSRSDYQVHYLEQHKSDKSSIVDPARFFICEFGRCLVRPENFYAHIQTHAEITTVTYYTCPFCMFFVKDIAKNRQIIRDHVLGKHAPRLREVITLQTARFLTGGCKFTSLNSQRRYIPIAPATNVVVPKIVSSCSIPSETFRLTACNEKRTPVLNNSTVPEIVNVKSSEINKNSRTQCLQNGIVIPTILNVGSMNSSGSQLMDGEVTDGVFSSASHKVNHSDSERQKENKQETAITEPCIMDEPNFATEVNCAGTVRNELEKNVATSVQIDEIKCSSISQVRTKHEATNVPSVKVENDDAFDSQPSLHMQQESLSSEENSISSTDVTSTFSTIDTKTENLEMSEESLDDVAEEYQPSLLPTKCLPQMQEEDKVTRKIMSNIQLLIKQKRRRKRPWRIALNSPNNSDNPPINYRCHLCSEMISTSWSVVNNHFNTKHSRDYKVAVVAPMLTRLKTSYMKIELKDDGRKRKLDSNITTAKKKRRWAHKKFPDRSTSPSLGICIRQESLQDTEGNFRCKKCECLFKDVNTLREHVASNHRIRGHFLICLECGENFVVAPSLQMHLKAFHGITDPITYMAQNTAYAPDMTDELEAQERIIESNQCYVCRAVFEDKAAVDKHMRVHGMAFLNRKRIEARNALKSPEKKAAIPSSLPSTNRVGQEIGKQSTTTNNNNQDVLPEPDSANVSILTRISRLLS